MVVLTSEVQYGAVQANLPTAQVSTYGEHRRLEPAHLPGTRIGYET